MLLSILISFSSYGEWEKITTSIVGDVHYIDKSTIKERNGYVYFWILNEYAEPIKLNKFHAKSSKIYKQTDCEITRYNVLSMLVYNQSMGAGDRKDLGKVDEWQHPEPNNTAATLLNYACNYVD